MTHKKPVDILFIEDDPAHAELTLRSFKRNKLDKHIVHLSDGQQALDYLNRHGIYTNPESSPRPNLILLDLRLPKVDGLEVLKEIRANPELNSIPVVILTTSGADSDIANAYAYNASSYLVKPIIYQEFASLIETFGLYWIVWNVYPNQ